MSKELVLQALKFNHELDKDDIIGLENDTEEIILDDTESIDYDNYEWSEK